MDVEKQVAERLRKIRKAAKISQEVLGEAVGVTYQQVQKYESGQDKIAINRLQEMAVFLGVPLRDFFEPDVWGKEMTKAEAELILAVRRLKNDERAEALTTILQKT